MPEYIIGIILLVVSLGYLVFCLAKMGKFIRDHRVCSRCGEEMKVVWVGRKVDARKEKVYFGGHRMIAGTSRNTPPFCGARAAATRSP